MKCKVCKFVLSVNDWDIGETVRVPFPPQSTLVILGNARNVQVRHFTLSSQ